jgi:flagellar hook-associated protein 1 FlgK
MSIYTAGVTGLRAAQLGMATTGHNIANATTDGYRRQEIVQTTAIPVGNGSGFIGQGTDVQTIKRVYDDFLDRQVTQNETGASYSKQYLQNVQQLDNVLGDRSSGLSTSIQKFFQTWNDLANYPSSTTARQAVLGGAQTVSNSLNSLGAYVQTLQDSTNSDIKGMVNQINSYASSIAKMNNTIANATVNGQPPNDLLDQRDQLVSNLNQLVGTSVLKDPTTGNYNVFIGTGYQLVEGTTANSITAQASRYDPSRLEVYDSGGVSQLSGGAISGGKLGAMLDYRANVLDPSQNALGRIAMVLSDQVNTLHTAGIDYNGAAGGNFFNSMSALPQAFASTSNTSAAVVTATLGTTSQLTTSDYKLSFSGGVYTLNRLSDGQSWSNANLATLSTNAAQGFTLTTSVAPNAGDSFLIRPTAQGANNLGLAISDPLKIAAADNTAVAGDTLNNANALAIAALQSTSGLVGGSTTIEGGYALLVGEIGNVTDEAKINNQAQSNLLTQTKAAQQSVSGVNLDEEAANLIRYQQAYQASAQIIKSATSMFDTLLSLGG